MGGSKYESEYRSKVKNGGSNFGHWTLDLDFSAIVANSFDGASGEGFFTQSAFLFCLGLFINERVTIIVRALKVVLSRISANVAVYTLRIYVICAQHIFPDAIIRISHYCLLSNK
jgi:hypothetical protein